ncbi:MAG: sugar ABC transporter ATP-binding protein [Solirubrobacterales bacterium]
MRLRARARHASGEAQGRALENSPTGSAGGLQTSTPRPIPAVRVEGLSKAYGATKALKNVSLTFQPGEVHALLGGNGSGKSTAVKVLAGVVPADSGSFEIGGTKVRGKELNPKYVRQLGLRFVHQQPLVFPELTVAENVALGFEFPRAAGGPIRWGEVRRRAEQLFDRFEMTLDPRQQVSALGPAGQAMVAIARALQDLEELGSAVLVLDEPTAALPPDEVRVLLETIRGYADRGLGVVLVTHRLEEVLEVAHSATILRDGKVQVLLEKADISHDRLVEGIVGATVDRSKWRSRKGRGATRESAEVALRVENLIGSRSAAPDEDNGALAGSSFQISRGEIVGIAGVLGSGRTRLLKMLFGLNSPSSGEIELDGEQVSFSDARDAMRRGVAYIPEDRAQHGLFHGMSVYENISIVTTMQYWRLGHLDRRSEHRDARSLMKQFAVRASGGAAAVGSLSGGNQQKVVLARWLRRPIKLLLLDEPTQGVDVGARADIFQAVNRAAREGSAVLMVCSEFEELTLVCDRILVMSNGSIVDEVDNEELDVVELEHIVHQGGSDG